MKTNLLKNLDRLLNPKSIAVFGGKDAEIVVAECLKMGFKGKIWPVNPNRETISNLKCFSSVKSLPAPPDASFIAVPRESAIQIVSELNKINAGGGVCYTAGFKEVGEEGKIYEEQLINVANDFALVGPNCYGVLNFVKNISLWPFPHGGEFPGFGAAIITQSGMLSNDLSTSRRAFPLAYMISAGNQSILRLEDYIEYFSEKKEVKAIGLHIEGIQDFKKFQKVALKALNKGVPIVALKTGSSEIGNSLVNSHTGSLSGSNELYDAFFDHLGIIRVPNPPEFLETLKFFCISGMVKGKKIAGFTCSGGGATMLADHAEKIGLEFVKPSIKTSKILKDFLPHTATVSNPLDYTTPIWGFPEKTGPVFNTFLQDNYDSAILIQDYLPPNINKNNESNKFYLNDAKEFLKAAHKKDIPNVICSTLQENMDTEIGDYLSSQKTSPMQGLDEALNSIFRSYKFYKRYNENKNKNITVKSFERIKTNNQKLLNEYESKSKLKDLNLIVPNSISGSKVSVLADINKINFPVSLKMLGENLTHKTDFGAITLNINNIDELEISINEMKRKIFDEDKIKFYDNFLVEEMMPKPILELLLGIYYDKQFGFCMTIGAGGIFTNLINDAISLILPCSPEEINKSLSNLKISKVIDGYRSNIQINKDILTKTIKAISDFVSSPNNKIIQTEINPLFIYENKIVIVDALIWENE